jgi:tetratricopeptide (TPR) repeat protein
MSLPGSVARSAIAARALGLSLRLALCLGLAACGGAFADAMKRGDQYAQAGMWDKAAAEYRTAQKLEPDNADVAIKLRQASQKQSGERLTRARALMSRGEIEAGLAVIQEAAKLDPDSTEAQRALDEANQFALQKAEGLLATPESRKAFELTQLVLSGSPNDPRARAMDDRVRDTLAEQAYRQAEQFMEDGKKGNALIAYAAALSYRPGFRDTKAQIGDVKLALQPELTFYVVLERFAVPGPIGGEQDIASRMKLELVAQAFDDHLPLRIVAAPPTPNARGVHITGALSAYRFGPPRISTRNEQCEYIRGYDTVPNPERASAERAVSDAEQHLAQAEREVDQNQRDVDRYQRELDDKQKEQARLESDSDRARSDYERCMANTSKSTSSTPCSSEKSRYDSAQSSVQSQRSRVQYSQSDLSNARQRMQNAADSRGRARHDVEDRQRYMRGVPPTTQQPHHERENFQVEVRSIDAVITLQLRAATLRDNLTLLDNETFPQVIAPIRDEGWLARPATCPSSGKGIRLPGEHALRDELVKMTIATVREKVQAMYESYRAKFLADARRQEANGAPEDAVESYVRYLLTGIKNIDPDSGKQISEFLQKTRGFGRIDLLGSL